LETYLLLLATTLIFSLVGILMPAWRLSKEVDLEPPSRTEKLATVVLLGLAEAIVLPIAIIACIILRERLVAALVEGYKKRA